MLATQALNGLITLLTHLMIKYVVMMEEKWEYAYNAFQDYVFLTGEEFKILA